MPNDREPAAHGHRSAGRCRGRRSASAAALAVLLLGTTCLARANSCSPASSGGTAPSDWASYCWLDFTGYSDAQVRSAAGQAFSFALSDGSTLNFALSAVSTAATALRAMAAPSWTGAAVGNTAFLGIPGNPVLYTLNNGSTVTLTLSNIRVTPPTGVTATSSYALVAADAESTNNGESLAFTTNGGSWTVLDQVPPISGSTYPTLTNAGATVTETGVAGTVGGYIFGSANSPTVLTARLAAGGLQGAMFAVRYAWVAVNKALTGTRVNLADQFRYAVSATATATTLVAGSSSGSGAGPFTRALVPVAAGYPVTVAESMAGGSTSPLASYVPSLTCSNATPGSPTPMPTAVAATSYNLGTLAYGDAVTCLFTNTALPRLTLAKALGGNRVFTGDQFTLSIANGATVAATTTTTGTGSALAGNTTPTAVVAAALPYAFGEAAAGTTVLSYYNAAMACSNAFAGSPTVLPTSPGGAVTPRAGDNITCTITNTPKSAAVTLNVQKTSVVLADPVNGASNPKNIPGSTTLYSIVVTNTGTARVDSNALVVTDVIPANTALYVATSSGAPVDFVDGPVPSGLAFAYPANVSFSNQPGGGAPYSYTPVPNGLGVDRAVTGVRIAPTGSMAGTTVAGQPSFTLHFRVVVQ